MFAVYVIALTSLVTVSHSSPPVCEELVRPFHPNFHDLEGRRALVAGSLNDTTHVEKFKSRDSASINFANETSRLTFSRAFGFGDGCRYLLSNVTLEDATITSDHNINISITFLSTSCADCLVLLFKDESKKPVRLYLFSKRREVEQKEVDEFRAQSECLNMLPPIAMDPNKELCPEKISSDSAPQTEEKTEGQKA